jgi:peptidylprolyl isomerase
MTQAKYGDTVKVHFTALRENGELLASTEGQRPVEVEIGSRRHIPGFEDSIVGMGAGETKTITVPPERGFGPRVPELIMDVSKDMLPQDFSPYVGKKLQAEQKDGSVLDVVITDMDETTVTIDANHPLAGETLTFSIQLLEVT